MKTNEPCQYESNDFCSLYGIAKFIEEPLSSSSTRFQKMNGMSKGCNKRILDNESTS